MGERFFNLILKKLYIMKTLNIPVTPEGKFYYKDEGIHSALYNSLYDELVPPMGECDTYLGNIVRAVSRLAYEYFNNGNMNACEINEDEDGRCDKSIASFYVDFIKLLNEFFKAEMPEATELLDDISDIILMGDDYGYSDKEIRPYTLLLDVTMYIIDRTPRDSDKWKRWITKI